MQPNTKSKEAKEAIASAVSQITGYTPTGGFLKDIVNDTVLETLLVKKIITIADLQETIHCTCFRDSLGTVLKSN